VPARGWAGCSGWRGEPVGLADRLSWRRGGAGYGLGQAALGPFGAGRRRGQVDRGGDRRRELVRTGGPWRGAASERTVDRLTLGRGGFGTEPGQVDLGQGRLRSGVRTGGPGGGATSGRTADRSSSGRSGAPERAGQVLPGGGGVARRWGQTVRGGDRGPERSWTGCPASRAAPPKGWDRLPRGLSCVFRGVDSASCPEKGFSTPVKLAEAAECGVAVLSVGWKGSTEGWVSGSGEVSASFLRGRALCGYDPPRADADPAPR
jgi:hypothetical protein